jgi:hypothetical protein
MMFCLTVDPENNGVSDHGLKPCAKIKSSLLQIVSLGYLVTVIKK